MLHANSRYISLINQILLNLLIGTSFGFVLFLIATGLSITMGLMRILNMAHGALFLVGAYMGLTLVKQGWNFFLAAILSGIVVGLLGLIIERRFLGRLQGLLAEQVLLTFGLVYVLINLCQWVWGPVPAILRTPVSGSIAIGGVFFPIYLIVVVAIGLLTAVSLYIFQEKTRIGSMVKAGMDNREMTMGVGINFGLVCSAVFSLGAFLAGFAGVIGVPMLGAHPRTAIDALLLSLIVVVVGGMGSMQGALLASLIIGLLDAFSKAFVPGLAGFVIYLALLVIFCLPHCGLRGKHLFPFGKALPFRTLLLSCI